MVKYSNNIVNSVTSFEIFRAILHHYETPIKISNKLNLPQRIVNRELMLMDKHGFIIHSKSGTKNSQYILDEKKITAEILNVWLNAYEFAYEKCLPLSDEHIKEFINEHPLFNKAYAKLVMGSISKNSTRKFKKLLNELKKSEEFSNIMISCIYYSYLNSNISLKNQTLSDFANNILFIELPIVIDTLLFNQKFKNIKILKQLIELNNLTNFMRKPNLIDLYFNLRYKD